MKDLQTSLKQKLLFSTLSVTFVFTITTALFLRYNYQLNRQETFARFHSESENLDAAIGAQFFERYGDVQAFARNTVLQDQSSENKAKIQAILNDYVKLYGIYTSILYINTEGQLIASNTQDISGNTLDLSRLKTSFLADQWFQSALNGRFTEDKAKGFVGTYVETAQIDPIATSIYGRDMFGNSFTSQVKDSSGKVIGILTNRADFSWVENELAFVSEKLAHNGFSGAEVAVLDSNGYIIANIIAGNEYSRDLKILASSNPTQARVQEVIKILQSKNLDLGIMEVGAEKEEILGTFEISNNKKFIQSLNWRIALIEDEGSVFAHLTNRYLKLFTTLLVLVIVFAFLSMHFAKKISGHFMIVADRLKASAEASHRTSQRLTKASQQVSDSSNEQSAAVQETVSSMSEIASMIAQTNSNVKECTQIASRVSSRTEQGNQTMRKLVAAMDAVNHANSQLQNMANIINEVSTKTNVINDIVFKTQLLSINASIEAARAGQHGKGFSVVAEEVGNLAQMSGNAAKEIQLLISDSQKQVLQIIDVTQSRSKESQAVSQEAVQAFSEIASGIVAINERLGGVTQATHEQEIGIQQISTAMSQMDQITQRNNHLANEANDLATEIGSQSELSFRIVRALRTLVLGSTAMKSQERLSFVDQLISGDQSEVDSEANREGQRDDSNLAQISNRLESRIRQSKTDTEEPKAALDNIDADDPSFKKPA